jgi:hypothetical protein
VLVSSASPLYTITASNWTLNNNQVTFSVSLTSGTFSFQVRGDSRFYTITDVIRVSMPTNVATSPGSYSYNGGLFTVSAVGLSPVSNIRVNGLKGQISKIDANTNTITYQLPPLLTTLTQSTYNIAKTDLIDLTPTTFFSDTASNSNVSSTFDGSISTYYGSSNSACHIGIDFGSGIWASISRVRLFPSLDWANTANKILDAKIEGSNDMTAWSTLAAVDQTIHSGWNTLASSSSNTFRYVRFAHSSISQCNIA